MNTHQLMIRRNNTIRELDWGSRLGRNFCKYNSGNTNQHEDYRWELFKYLRRRGKDVICEGKFTGERGRADLIVLDDSLIIEIVCSESDESILNKQIKYPSNLSFVRFKTTTPLQQAIAELDLMLE